MTIRCELRHDSNEKEVVVPSTVEREEKSDTEVDLRSAVTSCVDSPLLSISVYQSHFIGFLSHGSR